MTDSLKKATNQKLSFELIAQQLRNSLKSLEAYENHTDDLEEELCYYFLAIVQSCLMESVVKGELISTMKVMNKQLKTLGLTESQMELQKHYATTIRMFEKIIKENMKNLSEGEDDGTIPA